MMKPRLLEQARLYQTKKEEEKEVAFNLVLN